MNNMLMDSVFLAELHHRIFGPKQIGGAVLSSLFSMKSAGSDVMTPGAFYVQDFVEKTGF